MSELLHDISVIPLWLWITFTFAIVVLLFIDLKLFGRSHQKIAVKTALIESAIWFSISIAFTAWFAMHFGSELGLEFLTSYLVEKSLSVDNLFVILLIFKSLRIPDTHQHRVLFWGVLGAIILRAIFILLGGEALHAFHWVLYIFALFLIYTAIRFLRNSDKDTDNDTGKNTGKNTQESGLVRGLKRLIPTTKEIKGNQFFVIENGVRMATPLFLALIVIEASDLVFATDSIPAVFAVTKDVFVAFASNILAILGLRALYFVLADWVAKLRFLKPGLAAILGFIGVKMLIGDYVPIPNWLSLAVIFIVLSLVGFLSWHFEKEKKA